MLLSSKHGAYFYNRASNVDLTLNHCFLQNLVGQTSPKPSPKENHLLYSTSPNNSLLSSDGEKLESLKRALTDVQEELKDLHSALSLPSRVSRCEPIPRTSKS